MTERVKTDVNNASSRLLMNAAVTRSKIRLRLIFGLNVKSKLSSVSPGSRNSACFAATLQQSVGAPCQFVVDET